VAIPLTERSFVSAISALMFAAKYRHAERVKYLLENGADVNAKDNNSRTALMRAAEEEHTEVVELLKKTYPRG